VSIASLSELQLDALAECANIGSGKAATALSSLVGRPIDICVPRALVVPVDDVSEIAPPHAQRVGVHVAVQGGLEGAAVMLLEPSGADVVSGLLGVPAGDPLAASAVSEVANVLSAAYLIALGELSGLDAEPGPPQHCSGPIDTILADAVADIDHGGVALLLDSRLTIEDADAEMTFLLVPAREGVAGLLAALGVGA